MLTVQRIIKPPSCNSEVAGDVTLSNDINFFQPLDEVLRSAKN